jgi:hypothetical protein
MDELFALGNVPDRNHIFEIIPCERSNGGRAPRVIADRRCPWSSFEKYACRARAIKPAFLPQPAHQRAQSGAVVVGYQTKTEFNGSGGLGNLHQGCADMRHSSLPALRPQHSPALGPFLLAFRANCHAPRTALTAPMRELSRPPLRRHAPRMLAHPLQR